MDVPEALQERIELYKANGRLYREGDELFSETSWLAVMLGQRMVPKSYHPIVDAFDVDALNEYLNGVVDVIQAS